MWLILLEKQSSPRYSLGGGLDAAVPQGAQGQERDLVTTKLIKNHFLIFLSQGTKARAGRGQKGMDIGIV